LEQGELDRARSELRAIRRRAEEIDDREMVAFATVNLGEVAWYTRDFEESLEYAESAAELFRKGGDDGGVVTALAACGWAALALMDPPRAAGHFREALPIAGRLDWIRAVAENASGLGVALISLREAERGAQLVGAVGALLEEHGIRFDDELQNEIRGRAVAEAEAALGVEAFAAAVAGGEGMTLDEIVAYATA
jgi:hypothetical protein